MPMKKHLLAGVAAAALCAIPTVVHAQFDGTGF